MATPVGTLMRLGASVVLKPVLWHYPWLTMLISPRRCAHSLGSSLYEQARESYIHKPDLDMRMVCEEMDKVISNVESRKGDLQGADVRDIVSFGGSVSLVIISTRIYHQRNSSLVPVL